jgi:hypothetical protein
MGTRNLTIVKSKGKVKVAQYCQWDGYPSGQGANIVKFITTKLNTKDKLKDFKQKVDKLEEYTQEEISHLLFKHTRIDKHGMTNMEDVEKLNKLFPELSRDIGPKVLDLIADGSVRKIDNQIEFVNNTLYCEYIYELNLDKNELEVYTIYGVPPVALYPFDELDHNTMSKVEKKIYNKEEE